MTDADETMHPQFWDLYEPIWTSGSRLIRKSEFESRSILRLTNNVMCLRSRGRAEFRHRRKSLPPPSAEFWSARQPDLVRASRKSGGGAAEGSIVPLSID